MDDLPDIAISTSAYRDEPLSAALASIATLTPAAEIRSFGRHGLLDKRNRVAAERAGLRYSVHGPFGDTGIWDPDDRVRRQALEEHRRHLEAAGEVGAYLYVVHPDWHADVAPRDPAVAQRLERAFETLHAWQDETGVVVAVENMPGAGRSHFTHPGDLDLGGLGLVLDVGHAHISGCLDEWLEEPYVRLRHVHLHDNHGKDDHRDPHLGVGEGGVDVAAVMSTAARAGATVVLEHYEPEAVLSSLAHLRWLGLA